MYSFAYDIMIILITPNLLASNTSCPPQLFVRLFGSLKASLRTSLGPRKTMADLAPCNEAEEKRNGYKYPSLQENNGPE
jgi:hypothetical protein